MQICLLKDIWPSDKEMEDTLKQSLNAEMFIKRYSNVSEGPSQWQKIKTEESSIYSWDEGSTYVKKPPFLHIALFNIHFYDSSSEMLIYI